MPWPWAGACPRRCGARGLPPNLYHGQVPVVEVGGKPRGHDVGAKHVVHLGIEGPAPALDVSDECRALEHVPEIRSVRHAPPRQISLENTVSKHALHVLQLGNVPIGNVSIERRVGKHVGRTAQRGKLPLGEVPVERASIEHPRHVGNARDVPARQPQGLELCGEFALLEHSTHAAHVGNVPAADVAHEGATIKQFGEIVDTGDVDVVQIAENRSLSVDQT